MKYIAIIVCIYLSCISLSAQRAIAREYQKSMDTYPFSDPDPVPKPENLFYPYFRFDGFTPEKIEKEWKAVELENDFIRVSLFPEIGGKIWGALDKTSGKEFIYTNHVVKFRDIAMRGPWVSGGIEYNFGIIGHAPTSATPVDYVVKEKEDGSVSCYISAMEFITRTTWEIEVNLPKDKAYFTTRTTWYNSSSVDQPYYQWMNAGYKSEGDVQFCYPGTHYIKHSGELFSFPKDEKGRDLSWYKHNDFESDKSCHIIGNYNDFYGAYWHEDDFGSVHHAAYDEKLGMKIFLWSQARDGSVWEDLLTDTDGQYVELQSGRMYSQPATQSAYSPFKHTAFMPGVTDEWTEYWYPVKGTKGIAKASRIGALNIVRETDSLKLFFSPLLNMETTLRIYVDNEEVISTNLIQSALQTWHKSYPLTEKLSNSQLKVVIGNNELVYSEEISDNRINRPKKFPDDFDWNSAYGLYVQGEQWINQKYFANADKYLLEALKKDKYFVPALIRLSSLYYREAKYKEALELICRALSIDAYNGETNYLYGLINLSLRNYTDAKDGFAVASYASGYRTEAYVKLAACYMREEKWEQAIEYAEKSLQSNTKNLNALQELLVCYRKSGKQESLKSLLTQLSDNYPLNHVVRYEQYLFQPSAEARDAFISLIRNELSKETYMELSVWYESIGCIEEAIDLLSFTPDNPIACYKKAWLLEEKGEQSMAAELLNRADNISPEQVFPFRPENLQALVWASSFSRSWKPRYYQAILRHSLRDKQEALKLVVSCEHVDFIPFFLYRASLESGKERLADLYNAEGLGKSWRTGLELIKYYSDKKDWKQANEIAVRYYRQYPDNYVIGLQYARILCESEEYGRCISLLKNILVLPNEGAYAGRGVYREACLYAAIGYVNKRSNSKALKQIIESKVWLENLGVGKPYEDQIDYRLENFLEAHISSPERAKLLLEKVASVDKNRTHFESADLLSVLALRFLGKERDADAWVSLWKKEVKDNRVIEWCISVYEGNKEQSETLLKERMKPDEMTPWESVNVDRDFDLITKLQTLFFSKDRM